MTRLTDGQKLLIAQLRSQWRALALGMVLGLVWTAAKVAIPLLLKSAVDSGITAHDTGALVRWSLVIAGLGLVAACASASRRYLAFREARWTETALRNRLFAHIQRLHFGYHDMAQTGQLMSRANTDLQQVQAFVVMIPITISNLTVVVVVAVILASMNPLLTLLAMGGVPFVTLLATLFHSRVHPAMVAIQQESAELAAVVEETVAGVRIVKGFGAEGVQAARLEQEADDVYEAGMDAARVRARYLPALDLLPTAQLRTLPATGFLMAYDDPVGVARELISFFG